MPKLTKDAFSRFLRTDCDRQLRLFLAHEAREGRSLGMPDEQPPRPGLAEIRDQGLRWQHEKVSDLEEVFGGASVLADPRQNANGLTEYRELDLDQSLSEAAAAVGSSVPSMWIVEAEFPLSPAFETALGIQGYGARYGLAYGNLRPDLIEVLSPGVEATEVKPDGTLSVLSAQDRRFRLRVVDIKLTAEASVPYLAEVTLYSMALAAWLVEQGRDVDFAVVDSAAIWPGSHAASELVQLQDQLADEGRIPTLDQLHAAIALDLEHVPFDVFAPRVRDFFKDDLPRVLDGPWEDLPWHVDTRCRSCPFLGVKSWKNAEGKTTWQPGHCMPMAETSGQLSRVADVGRGARAVLEVGGVANVADLATRKPEDPILDTHQALRAGRTVVTKRAEVLNSKSQSVIAPTSGTSATMPKWADLRIEISTDFDPGTALSFSFAAQAFWLERKGFGESGERQKKIWRPAIFVVDDRKPDIEEREFLNFLGHLHSILDWAREQDPETTVQFYVWDELETKQFSRVVGRHLAAILGSPNVKDLAWLFPSEELLPNPKFATRRSPLTVVRNVVRATVAAPIAHYYSLLELAREFHDKSLPANIAEFSTHPLFEDPLSDQIPPERAHEIWSRSTTPYWGEQMSVLKETVRKRLIALATVRRRLEEDLNGLTQVAPKIRIGALEPAGKMAFGSELWLAFTRLDEALSELEADQIRAMPPHEREARFASARLEVRLSGKEEEEALSRFGLNVVPGLRVYRLSKASAEVKVRDGDIGFAVAPEDEPGFLDRALNSILKPSPLPEIEEGWRTRMSEILKVTVIALDRDSREIVVVLDRFMAKRLGQPNLVEELEAAGVLNLKTQVVLDPVHTDFLTKKLRETLQAIGNPPSAQGGTAAIKAAMGSGSRRGARRTAESPPAEFLWGAAKLAATSVPRSVASVRAHLEASGLIRLNESQWEAWGRALTSRLALIWGPPGTGKSQTLRAVATGAALHAHDAGEGIRILISASTYTAIDNVLIKLIGLLEAALSGADLRVARIRSGLRGPQAGLPEVVDHELNRWKPSAQINDLKLRLSASAGITVVAGTPQQVWNLMLAEPGSAQQELFDLIVLDEASQLDVSNAILSVASLAADGSVVLAGDPLQLPPIHQAEPPVGLEAMVGSAYEFISEHHGVKSSDLRENYRSNEQVVEFARRGGYEKTLLSVAPQLELSLASPAPGPSPGWPTDLLWTPEWDNILNPSRPTVAFIYDDQAWSTQWNRFEADAVASVVWRLRERMQKELLNQVDPQTREPRSISTPVPIDDDEFWERGVGIVTPHRAQQALVISALKRAFPETSPEQIRDAVDTVERFQGQERDVIIATFALGDPDAIADEDEFLLAFNRFNVVASRARAKLIVFVSEQVIDHLSDDIEVLRDSRLLKLFVNSFCDKGVPMTLGYGAEGQTQSVSGEFRFR